MENPNNTTHQLRMQPQTECTAELVAKIASLQAQLDLLKSMNPRLNSDYSELKCENELLQADLAKARECIQIMLMEVEKRDEEIAKLRSILEREKEKEIDRKGKKVVQIDDTSEKAKGKSLICFTKSGTDEVLDVMQCSDSSDDSGGEEEGEEEEEEEDIAQLKTLLKMGRFDGVGSSSKMGSGSGDVGEIQSGSEMDCILSNGEEQKLKVLDEIKSWSDGFLSSEYDLIPKYLNFGEITSWGKKLYGPNYSEFSNLMGLSETGGLVPDRIKFDSTTETSRIEKLSEMEGKLTCKKRKWEAYWESEEQMLCSLTSSPEMLLEAVCALYRQERRMRLWRPKGMHYKGLSGSDYHQYVNSF